MAEKVSPEQFTRVLKFLQRMYSYVVVDTSTNLTDMILSTFDISDVIVLVTTQEIPAIKNARLFLDLLHTIGITNEHVVFVMNRYDKKIAITPQRVSDNLKHEVSVIIPLDGKVVVAAVNRGVPFMLDNKSQPVGRGVFSLAQAVRAKLNELESQSHAAVKR
ncbi:MAG: hypothetical protein FJZ86_11755 [Chloroflexi bacterium]|nr:hypothetical protein [Chloroflexota bacterium]